jgi:LPS O-antigen subunit length determinant protein (WzzB/FepE family)
VAIARPPEEPIPATRREVVALVVGYVIGFLFGVGFILVIYAVAAAPSLK